MARSGARSGERGRAGPRRASAEVLARLDLGRAGGGARHRAGAGWPGGPASRPPPPRRTAARSTAGRPSEVLRDALRLMEERELSLRRLPAPRPIAALAPAGTLHHRRHSRKPGEKCALGSLSCGVAACYCIDLYRVGIISRYASLAIGLRQYGICSIKYGVIDLQEKSRPPFPPFG